jgi:hypothetical protein
MALIIQYIALGQDQAEQMLKAQSGRLYEVWIGSGLTIAGLDWYCSMVLGTSIPNQCSCLC